MLHSTCAPDGTPINTHYHEFLYYDYHGEYVPKDFTPVWNGHSALGQPNEDAVAQAFALLYPNFTGQYEMTHGHAPEDHFCNIYYFRGTEYQLVSAFNDLAGQLMSLGHPSGDDDCYDYWPSGLQLLLDIARDLDGLFPLGYLHGEMALPYCGRVWDFAIAPMRDPTDICPRPRATWSEELGREG